MPCIYLASFTQEKKKKDTKQKTCNQTTTTKNAKTIRVKKNLVINYYFSQN